MVLEDGGEDLLEVVREGSGGGELRKQSAKPWVSKVLRQDSEYRSPEQNAPRGTLRFLQEEGRRKIVARCAEDRTIKGGGQDSLGRAREDRGKWDKSG